MRICLSLLTLFALCLPAGAQDNPDEPTEPEGKVRLTLETGGHSSLIHRVLFTPDGSQIVTLATDQSIRVWDVETGECVNVLYPPLSIHAALAQLAPDGRRLAVSRIVKDKGKASFSILLIALAEGRIERVLAGPAITGGSVLAFSPDGKRLASIGGNKTVCIWDLEKEKAEPEKTFATPGIARWLAFSPDGKRLAQSGEWSGVLDVEAGKAVRKLFDGTSGERVAWGPDGKTLAFASQHGLQLWDPDGKQARAVIEKDMRFTAVSFSADSQTLLASEAAPAQNRERVRTFLYDVASAKPKKTLVGEPLPGHKPGAKPAPGEPLHQVDERVHDSALSPDGKLAAAVGRIGGHHQLLVWQTSDGKLVQHLSSRQWYSVPEAAVAWSPDGKMVIWNHGAAARGFLLEDLSKPGAKPGDKPVVVQAPRPIGKPPEPAPAQLLDQRGFRLVPAKGEKTVTVFKGNKPMTIAGRNPVWWASFFGKEQVAVQGNGFWVADANTGKKVRDLAGHHSYVLNFGASPHQPYLASTSWDQVICIHRAGDLKPGDPAQPILSLYVAGREWVAWTPEGYYAASPGGERLMGWVVETSSDEMCTFHPASRFRPRLYRPDVIRLLLKEGSLDKALAKADAAAGKASKEIAVTDVLPPEVKVKTAPRPGTPPKAAKLKIEAVATAKGADPITELQLLIDDRPWGGEKGKVTLPKPDKGPVKASWNVDLGPGKHNIRVLARTGASLGSSRGMVRDTDDDQPATKKKEPALYVLSVGINDYKAIPKLGGAVNDATEFEKVLQKHSKPLFSKYETKMVLDKEATKAGILKGLDWLQERQTASDIAVFYYAGHGDLDRQSKEFYLLPQDTDPKDLAKTALSRAELKKRMQALPGRVVVVLDACHTGAVGLLFDDVSRELVDEDCGVVVICAASPKETAKEKQHGFLTLALMDALSGKAQTRDGRVYLHHLPPYLIDQVEEMSKDQQHPTVVVPPWLHSFSLSKP